MKKKAPVLWITLDKWGGIWSDVTKRVRSRAKLEARQLASDMPHLAPFRVVKYLPAPKPKKREKAK